jgi:hypothetical protein
MRFEARANRPANGSKLRKRQRRPRDETASLLWTELRSVSGEPPRHVPLPRSLSIGSPEQIVVPRLGDPAAFCFVAPVAGEFLT